MSLPAQGLSIGLEFPEAVDGLGHAMPALRSAIESRMVAGERCDVATLTERPSELWLEAMAGVQRALGVVVSGVEVANAGPCRARKSDRQATEACLRCGSVAGAQPCQGPVWLACPKKPAPAITS